MHIKDRLKKEMDLHEEKTGKKCWAIYVGRNEMKELLAWAEESSEINEENLEGRKRPQYKGALVYLVNDDVHLNVS